MQSLYNRFFKIFYLFIFREREREGEREGEKHQCVVASHTLPTGDLACNPDMCPDWGSNQRPVGLQACAQSTELHQPGLYIRFRITHDYDFQTCHHQQQLYYYWLLMCNKEFSKYSLASQFLSMQFDLHCYILIINFYVIIL